MPIKLTGHKDFTIIIYVSFTDEGLTFSYLESTATYPEEHNILLWLESITKRKILFFPKDLEYIYQECLHNPNNILNIFLSAFLSHAFFLIYTHHKLFYTF